MTHFAVCLKLTQLCKSTTCVLSHFSRVQLFETLWTVALQAPLSMGFSRQEYWNGLPFLPPGHLPDHTPIKNFKNKQVDPPKLSF